MPEITDRDEEDTTHSRIAPLATAMPGRILRGIDGTLIDSISSSNEKSSGRGSARTSLETAS
jgi:hypothetical protein